MAQVIVTESSLENIAGAIRSKLGTQATYKPAQMAGAIAQIHGDPVLEELTTNANGTFTPSSGKDGFSRAIVNVANSYSASDEGKVVSNGALVGQSLQGINANGTYNTTLKNEVVVNVPNSYSASDEGKVVDNGALVAQGSQSITQNGTYNTTLKKQVIVNVSGGGGGSTILSGTDEPSASVGSNGDIYLQYATESLKNTTTQYINTGYHGNNNSEYKVAFKLESAQGSTYPTPFGARSAPGAVQNASYVHLGATNYVAWGTSQYNNPLNFSMSDLIGKKATLELKAGFCKLSFGGNDYTYTFTPTSISDTTPMGLFAALWNERVDNTLCQNMDLYYFEISESGTLVHRFVPALDSNDVPCVYDEVTEEYKYNSGSGSFIYDEGGDILSTYLKVNGTWQNLIGSDIDDVNT